MEFAPDVALVADGRLEQTGLGVGQQVDDRRALDHRPHDTGRDVEGVEDLDPSVLQAGDPPLVGVRTLLAGDYPADPVLLRQQGQAGVLPVIPEGDHQDVGVKVVPLVKGRLIDRGQVGQVADLGVEGLVVLLIVGYHPNHVPVLGELLGDRHRDRVCTQDDDPLLDQIRLPQLIG